MVRLAALFLMLTSIALASARDITPQTAVDFRQALAAGDLSKAGKLLKTWASQMPEDPGLILAQGLWWHASAHQRENDREFLSDAEQAARFLEKAYQAAPRRLDIRLEFCDVLLDVGNDERFLTEVQALSKTAPEGGWLWDEDTALPLKPDLLIPNHLEEMAWGLVRGGDKASTLLALRLAALAVQRFPNHPGGYRVRGRIALESEHFQNAKKDLTLALDLDPDDSESLMDLAQVLWELEQDQDSRRVYERVLALNKDPDAVHRAKMLLQKMNEDGL
jgi:tetratricopeptide (TPR) repeat protein